MRHFVYFSRHGVTSGKTLSGDLMKAGRMDIAIHSFIQAVYLSNDFRKDVIFHFVLYGMPDPPKHIEIQVTEDSTISKKDVAGLIRKILYKSKGDTLKGTSKKIEVFPGCFVEKKSFLKVIEELRAPKGVQPQGLREPASRPPSTEKKDLSEEGKRRTIFILDKKGEDIRKAEIPDDSVFVLGDHDGLPEKELRRLKKTAKVVNVGPKMYFASQVVAVLNNELDRREI